jgi:hypothetical protein
MITGAHTLLYSRNPELDRSFFRDVLSLPNVDVGDGWLIFGLPPAEVAVHGTEDGGSHELYLMCDEIQSFVTAMQDREVECTAVEDQGWGLVTHVTLPGGSKLGVYEPRHARPENPGSNGAAQETLPSPPRKRRAVKKKRVKARPVAKSAPKAPAAKSGKAKKKVAKKKKR